MVRCLSHRNDIHVDKGSGDPAKGKESRGAESVFIGCAPDRPHLPLLIAEIELAPARLSLHRITEAEATNRLSFNIVRASSVSGVLAANFQSSISLESFGRAPSDSRNLVEGMSEHRSKDKLESYEGIAGRMKMATLDIVIRYRTHASAAQYRSVHRFASGENVTKREQPCSRCLPGWLITSVTR